MDLVEQSRLVGAREDLVLWGGGNNSLKSKSADLLGRPIDVMVDRLTMCHTLDLRPAFGRQRLTVDAIDVLLSKLQIVELNEKDARDIIYLLSALPLGGTGASLDTDRYSKLLGADWGCGFSPPFFPAGASSRRHARPPMTVRFVRSRGRVRPDAA